MAKHSVKRKYIAATNEDRDAEHICGIIDKMMKTSDSETSAESYDAKSMLLFGNSLFPDNFRMKFQSYKIAKRSGEVVEAAQLFRTMYLNFPNEQSFYAELCAVIEDVRTEQKTTNTDLFQNLSKSMQCEILLKFCQTTSSALDEANLKLFIMRDYPHTVREHAFDVIEALKSLERESYPHDSLNVFRQRLVCDLLPLLFSQMGKKKELDAKLVANLTNKALSFHLTYGLARQPGMIRGANEEHPRLAEPFLSVRQLLEAVSVYFSWGSLQLPRLPRTAGQAANSQSQQSVKEFVQSVDQALQSSRSPHRLVLPLVVAHVETCAIYLNRSKQVQRSADRRVEQQNSLWLCTLESVKDELPIPEEDENDGEEEIRRRDIATAFALAMKIWRHAIRLNKEGRKEFDEMLKVLRLDAWHRLQIFYAETATLHFNPFKECQLNDRLAQIISGPTHMFLDAQIAWEKRKPHAVRQLIHCLQALYSAEVGRGLDPASLFPLPSDLDNVEISGHCQLTRLSFSWLFNFLVNMLIRALTPVCRKVTAWNHNAFGHSLILLQWDLSDNSVSSRRMEWVRSLFSMIKQYGSLRYPSFFNYVINTDLLEEVVLLQRATRPAAMLLSPDIGDKTKEEDETQLTKHAQLQVEKCYQPIGPLLYEFLVREMDSIVACFS